MKYSTYAILSFVVDEHGYFTQEMCLLLYECTTLDQYLHPVHYITCYRQQIHSEFSLTLKYLFTPCTSVCPLFYDGSHLCFYVT